MRIVIHDYVNGDGYAYETTNDGDFIRDLHGHRQVGAIIRVDIELMCDGDDAGRQALLGWLDRAKGLVRVPPVSGP